VKNPACLHLVLKLRVLALLCHFPIRLHVAVINLNENNRDTFQTKRHTDGYTFTVVPEEHTASILRAGKQARSEFKTQRAYSSETSVKR
jgi:hypothetical protein